MNKSMPCRPAVSLRSLGCQLQRMLWGGDNESTEAAGDDAPMPIPPSTPEGLAALRTAYPQAAVEGVEWSWPLRLAAAWRWLSSLPGLAAYLPAKPTPGRAELTHLNLNDRTVEGLAVKGQPTFSVQYHPEAAAGPHDAAYLFDRFTALMSQVKSEKKNA